METASDMTKGNESIPETPMGRVWSIVLGTMFVVSSVSFIWHYLGMLEIRKEQALAEQEISRDIESLTAFRADIVAKSSTTAGTNTK